MAVTVVVGGQFGGEGKGKLTSYLSLKDDVGYVVRCGGPNSGHTVDLNGKRYQLRAVPAGFVNSRSRLLLAAGSLIDPSILLREIELCGIDPGRVGIDWNAGVITENEIGYERDSDLKDRIGSTLSGTGAAVAARALRKGHFRQARQVAELQPLLASVAEEVNSAIDRGETVLVEGTQGYGLSLYHCDCYPYATSRDTTASAFLSEVGLSPLTVTAVIMVVRTYPIRVGGHSGPLKGEITWDALRERSGYPFDVIEYTTATGRVRRVADFDLELVKRAVRANRPTAIALNGVDYLDYRNKGVTQFEDLTTKARQFVSWLEEELRTTVAFVGTGPTNEELIDMATVPRSSHLASAGAAPRAIIGGGL